jgi:hypothetical protein
MIGKYRQLAIAMNRKEEKDVANRQNAFQNDVPGS